MPRQPKFDAERQHRFLDAIAAGATRRAACACAGISERTLERHLLRSVAFDDTLRAREAEAEVQLVRDIRQDPDWRAKAWLLAHRWPNEWGQRAVLEVHFAREQYIRRKAVEYGLDPDEAVIELLPRLPSARDA